MKRTEIEALLPAIYQRTAVEGSPLTAILDVMEGMHAPVEATLEALPFVFQPLTAPDAFVPLLATWLDLGRFLASDAERWPAGLGQLRLLVAGAAELARWRGTARGLIAFLELATGDRGFTIDEAPRDELGQPRPFHLVVRAPERSRPMAPLIASIVESEKPAYTTVEIRFEGAA
jgi:phage tail-like protein